MKASRGLIHYFESRKPSYEAIHVDGLPTPWENGGIYLTLDEARELIEELQKALESGPSFVFGGN